MGRLDLSRCLSNRFMRVGRQCLNYCRLLSVDELLVAVIEVRSLTKAPIAIMKQCEGQSLKV